MWTSGWMAMVMFLRSHSVEPSSDVDGLSGDPRRVRRRKEGGDRGDVLGLADAAQRRLRFGLLAHLALGDAGSVDAFGFDHAGIDRVDSNAARAEFLRERARDRIDRTFGAAVNRSAGDAQRADDGTDVDDTSTPGTKVLRRRL